MSKQEEKWLLDIAKQDVTFLKHLELISHDDRPDFILKDKQNRKIGLEHFRADVYRIQDENSIHISGGNTILNKSKNEIYKKYHTITVNNAWTDDLIKNASNEFFGRFIKDSLIMRSNYEYEAFLDNLHVTIHGKLQNVKGHIQKSRNYPNRESYDLMGFLIEIPVPSFRYYFETFDSRQISKTKEFNKISRQYNKGFSYQKINGLPITNEIWKELDVFENINFIIIETYNVNNPQEHYGQYFDKNTPKPLIYPAFSFGYTDILLSDVQTEYKNSKVNVTINFQTRQSKCNIVMTKTRLKAERRKQSRKMRKYFDKAMKQFLQK